MAPVQEKVITPADKTLLPEKFFLMMNPANGGWPADGNAPSYISFWRSEEGAKAALQIGCVLYECSPTIRYVCKKEITVEK